MTDRSSLDKLLDRYGLVVLGVIDIPGPSRESALVLVGNAGSAMWSSFIEAPEFFDGGPNPLDRWTRRVGSAVASKLGAEVVFPFDGPPYPPFLEWARQTGQAFPSPLSMFIHGDHGLWHAYRFALKMTEAPAGRAFESAHTSPCLSCPSQPCLEACPVSAFSTGEYQVDACMAYLTEHTDSSCREVGCKARRACPVGAGNQYEPAHARFHMDAFVRSGQSLSKDNL